MSGLQSFYKGKKVLVTGHTGFKGSWLCSWLKLLEANISGFALMPEDFRGNHFNTLKLDEEIHSVIGDIRNYDDFKEVVSETEPDIIFHLAAQPLVRDSYDNPIESYSSNVIGTVNLFDIINKQNRPVSVVNITTDKCYENIETEVPYIESDRIGGHDPYSASKACAEIVTTSFRKSFFCKESPIKLASARAGNIIGGGDFVKDRIIPDIVEAIANDINVEIRSPNSVRPWQFILDVLYGYLLLGKAIFENDSRDFETAYNFAPLEKEFVTVKEITEIFIEKFGRGSYEINSPKNAPHEAKLLLLDSSKAFKELGWKNQFNVTEALEHTANWYKNYVDNNSKAKTFTIKQIENYMGLV